ncbi:hypothetical protein E2C01_019783 [Portunus trituberculatus]|uniref:Uncharacterized protein n=1 Tax=Portunus trituberculatus TaxID=210409 RepID=A0A5B7DZX7_PORTR|nr:hypothetical protein [Portunus trituberculatus]
MKLNDELSNCEACTVLSFSTFESPLGWNATRKSSLRRVFPRPFVRVSLPIVGGTRAGRPQVRLMPSATESTHSQPDH